MQVAWRPLQPGSPPKDSDQLLGSVEFALVTPRRAL